MNLSVTIFIFIVISICGSRSEICGSEHSTCGSKNDDESYRRSIKPFGTQRVDFKLPPFIPYSEDFPSMDDSSNDHEHRDLPPVGNHLDYGSYSDDHRPPPPRELPLPYG
jgi:hypothetical protein